MAFKLRRPKLSPLKSDEGRGYSDDLKANWHKHKKLAKGSVANLLKAARGTPRKQIEHEQEEDDEDDDDDEEEEEKLGPRPVPYRVKGTPTKISVPGDLSDDVLDRLTSERVPARKPTSNFLANQRRRAGLASTVPASSSPSPPSAPPSSQAELDRKPLNTQDVIFMFAGSPYFSVDTEGALLRPRATLGRKPSGQKELRDATDYRGFKHASFNVCTVHAVDENDDSRPKKRNRRQLQEIPSMRSAQGKDPGAVGMAHFLELPLQQTNTSNDTARIHRQQMLAIAPEALGLRPFDIDNVVDRLVELSKVHEMLRSGKGEATEWDQGMIEDIGEDLFSTLLSPSLATTTTGTGSVSLLTQISALQEVLGISDLWPDFNDGDWRMRLGQLFWEPSDLVAASGDHVPAITERDVLMLQIALGAELAVRLQIASRLADTESKHPDAFATADLDAIFEGQTGKLDWDVLLFERFVDCFEATSDLPGASSPLGQPSSVSLEDESAWTDDGDEPDLVFQLRNEHEQFDGLHTFAKELAWPDLTNTKAIPALPKFDSFMTPPIDERAASDVSEYDTPLSSPALPPVLEKTPALVLHRKSKLLLPHAAFDELNGGMDQGSLSWVAKSWLSGFIMPGYSTNLSLMITLLELSPGTKHLLKEALNTNDGFVHKRQMYWAKDSVVGRVLAPAAGAKECMGWISLPFVPQNQGDGWICASVKDAPYALMKPRILSDGLIARSSDPLYGCDVSTLQAGDYITVLDGHLTLGNEAQFDGVSLAPSKDYRECADGFWVPKTVSMTFSSPRNHKLQPMTIPLTHAVYFVSSHPCFPLTQARPKALTARDSLQPTDSGESTRATSPKNKDLPPPPAHPLHVNSTYTNIPAAALLSSALPEIKDSDSLVLHSPIDQQPPSIYQIEDQEVIVLDCRASSDLEVLARAWCAKVGENALIGHKGRTCLACCIREAVGLGIGIVIRTS